LDFKLEIRIFIPGLRRYSPLWPRGCLRSRARSSAGMWAGQRARVGGRVGGDGKTARRPEKRAAAEVCEKGKMPFDGDDNAKYEELQDSCR